MVAKGKGLLAADESTGTIKKRFDAIGVESTADSRRDYREMMFRTDAAMKNHISGVILYDETIRHNAKDGPPLVKLDRGQAWLDLGHQGRQGHQAALLLPRRNDHRGARWPRRALRRVLHLRPWARASPNGAR